MLRLPSSSVNQKIIIRLFSTAAGEKIGFIGLGAMGSHQAKNLIKNGHSVVVYDVNKSAIEELKAAGAETAASPAEIASQAKVVVTMLPTSKHVNDVFRGPKGLLEGAQSGTLFLDSSTIDPILTKALAAEVVSSSNAESAFLDCPVSGGTMGAAAGTLTFMVGGPKDKFEIAARYLKAMGKNIVYCGEVGSGQVVKVCNNLILGVSMLGVAEAMHLGVKLGVDPKTLAGVINTSSGRCWSSDTCNPAPGAMEGVPSSRGYTGGFQSKLMKKDIGLALEAARSQGIPLPYGSAAYEQYDQLCSFGDYATKDFSSYYDYLQHLKVNISKLEELIAKQNSQH